MEDLRAKLCASIAIAQLKRFAAEVPIVMERTPADELRQCLSVLVLEIEHPHPDKDGMRAALRRIEIVAQRLERGER